MKLRKIFVEAIIVFALLCLVAPLNAAIPPLHVDGNKIKDPNGNIVVLRGIALIDLGFIEGWEGGAINMMNRITDKNDTQGSSPGWYPRVVRIPIAAPDQFIGWPHPFNPDNNDLYNLLRTVVDYCAAKDIYVIICWFYISHTYDHVASTSQFWTYMAPRFANDKHVLFELFNEPNDEGSSELERWLTVRANMQTWINVVRTYAPDNLILVAGPSYSQEIGLAASYPLTGNNIVMVSHIYPAHWLSGNKSWYTNHITTCAAVYPIMMTEWGFTADPNYDDQWHLLMGTVTNFGQPLTDFREQYQIGNTADQASYSWAPPMFHRNWSLRVGEGEMGGFVKDKLYEKRYDDQAGVPPQTPYGGVIWAVPGTIEAENYDIGGEGVSYYDTTAGNGPGAYRPDDVDIEACGEGGYNVTGIKPGEFVEYTVNVESTGIYQIEARAASAGLGGSFRILFDNANVTGDVNFPATGGAQIYTNVDVNGVVLHAGRHIVRLSMDSNDWNINWIKFTRMGGGTGMILREWWTGISGTSVSNLTSDVNYPVNPNGRELITKPEGPLNWAENYGTRIRGYLGPAASGSYTFWIASDANSELWLSSDADPCNAARIAYVSGFTSQYVWTKYASQASSPVSLIAGQRYYIEALHKEGTGSDHIEVAWEGPGISRQVIEGKYLSPCFFDFRDFSDFAGQWRRSDCSETNAWCSGADRDRDGSVQFDDLNAFADEWLLGAD